MTREEMIERLIDDRIESIYQGGDPEQYLRELFRYGNTYKGYEELTDKEIKIEYNETFETFEEDEQ